MYFFLSLNCLYNTCPPALQVNYVSGCPNVLCPFSSGFAAAVAAAKQSDFVVYVGGINRNYEGEGNDRADIQLPGLQSTLIQMWVH